MNKNESVKPTDKDLTQKQNNSINNILDSNTIKRFLGIKYCQNKMIIPVIVDRTDFEYLEEYWEKGGTYVLPVDIVNDLTGRIEELVAEVKELNVSLTWWQNRYNANEKLLERYRTDENGSSKDTTGNNQEA